MISAAEYGQDLTSKARWAGRARSGMDEADRQSGARVRRDTRYSIASLGRDAKRFAEAVRGGNSPQNFSALSSTLAPLRR